MLAPGRVVAAEPLRAAPPPSGLAMARRPCDGADGAPSRDARARRAAYGRRYPSSRRPPSVGLSCTSRGPAHSGTRSARPRPPRALSTAPRQGCSAGHWGTLPCRRRCRGHRRGRRSQSCTCRWDPAASLGSRRPSRTCMSCSTRRRREQAAGYARALRQDFVDKLAAGYRRHSLNVVHLRSHSGGGGHVRPVTRGGGRKGSHHRCGALAFLDRGCNGAAASSGKSRARRVRAAAASGGGRTIGVYPHDEIGVGAANRSALSRSALTRPPGRRPRPQ